MILVSACLVVNQYVTMQKVVLLHWFNVSAQGLAKSICPECLGGLPIPRPAAEIQGGSGEDVLVVAHG